MTPYDNEDWFGRRAFPETRFDEIEELGRTNVIVRSVLDVMRRDSTPMVQTLEVMVIELARINAVLLKRITDLTALVSL